MTDTFEQGTCCLKVTDTDWTGYVLKEDGIAHPFRQALLVGLGHAVQCYVQLVLFEPGRVQSARPEQQTHRCTQTFFVLLQAGNSDTSISTNAAQPHQGPHQL